MLDRWLLIDRKTDKIEMQGTLEEILTKCDVGSPEEISDDYTLTKPQNYATGDHETRRANE